MDVLNNFDSINFGKSMGYLIGTGVLMQVLRLVARKTISSGGQTLALLLEFLATFEFLASCFELGIIMQTHGFAVYGSLLIVFANYWIPIWGTASVAPHPHLLSILRRTGAKIALMKLLCQLTAAACVFTLYVKPIWAMGFREVHLQKLKQAKCNTLVQVPMAEGLAVEALGTFVLIFGGRLLKQMSLSKLSVPLVLVMIKYLGSTYTGAFMNGVLASTIQFGCEGITARDHFLVYWVGPLIGLIVFQIVATIIDGTVEKTVATKKAPQDKNKKTKTGKRKPKKE